MCLLDVLARLKHALGLELEAAHVDHGLSEASERSAARVAHHGAAAGFEVHVVRLSDLAGPNLQARARALRYGFLDLVMQQTGASRIATGHTLDDRAETTLARLVHGAGTAGLAGLPALEGPRMRPLAEVRRAETRVYCRDCGIEFFDDPANEQLRFERVAVRSTLMAPLEGRWGSGAVRSIARSADRLHEDAIALDRLAERIFQDVVKRSDGHWEIDREAILALPRALQRRLLERAVGRVRDRSAGIDEVLDHLAGDRWGDSHFDLAAGIEIEMKPQGLTVRSAAGE